MTEPTVKTNEQRGIALLLTIVLLTVGSLIVFELARTSQQDQYESRMFSERIKASYIAKSALNFSRILLEIPKMDGYSQDWLGEPWALFNNSQLPIDDFIGSVKLLIVDEGGKIDLNNIAKRRRIGSKTTKNIYWMEVLESLFSEVGFKEKSWEEDSFMTPGNRSFNPSQQVAVLHDWIDKDKSPMSHEEFSGQGIESNQDFFYNRPLRSLIELPLVPGFTKSRVEKISQFVRASTSTHISSINVNTAPLKVLMALGISEIDALELISERTTSPITREMIQSLDIEDAKIRSILKTNTNVFSVFVLVESPASKLWLKARIHTTNANMNRKTYVKDVRIH